MSGTRSEIVFQLMKAYLAKGEGKDIVPKVKAKFGFNILAKKGGKPVYQVTINLKEGNGSVDAGAPSDADAIFTMVDGDFEQVCKGTLNPQVAFMQGKMKIKGNMAAATKFTPELFPPPTEENLKKYLPAGVSL